MEKAMPISRGKESSPYFLDKHPHDYYVLLSLPYLTPQHLQDSLNDKHIITMSTVS